MTKKSDNQSGIQTALRDYLKSLKERDELDELVYNLTLAKGWRPFKLPNRGEAEKGADITCFASNEELVIFVLKDERLTADSWKRGANFQADFLDACCYDLDGTPEYKTVKSVKVIVLYNKDDNRHGVESFEQACKQFEHSGKVNRGEHIQLRCERWNLEKVAAEVEKYLFNPNLLPKKLSSALHYLCMQAADFEYGSSEWDNLFVPLWQDFLNRLLDSANTKSMLLLRVTLLILKKNLPKTPNAGIAWIELLEWAVLYGYDAVGKVDDQKVQSLFFKKVFDDYFVSLLLYFEKIENIFSVRHALAGLGGYFNISSLKDAYVLYWHVGRLGIFSSLLVGGINTSEGRQKEVLLEQLRKNVAWV